jgi:predicted DNA-binding transcriptional regulator YafY
VNGAAVQELHPDSSAAVIRLLWMILWLTHKPVLRLSDVRERWGDLSMRTFRRDLARMRDAGLIIDPANETSAHDPAVTQVGWRAA